MNGERNNTNFSLDLLNDLKDINADNDKNLKKWQIITRNYIMNRHAKEKHTGLLIFHEMGYGKTRIAVALLKAMGNSRPTLCFMTKNLQTNFDKGADDYKKAIDDNADIEYNFVTINSSNMFKKTRLHRDILMSLQDNSSIGKYVLPVKFSQRIVFAEVDAADSNPRSIFDYPAQHVAVSEAEEVCSHIAERIFE